MFQSFPQEPVKELPDQSGKQWAAGANGEKIVSTFLSNKLSDEWTYLRGYENRKSEIDGILIGTTGLFTLEIKYRRGTLICNGDRWLIDRYDKYGNLVERLAEFQKGRSPSQQLNEPANVLEETLRRKGFACPIFRMVVLSHEKAEIEEIKNITVDEIVVLHEWDLEKTLKKGKMNFNETEASRIIDIIRKDHGRPVKRAEVRRPVQSSNYNL
ncbi:MAG: NERD domain-containing protein [Deltaproteobacteria bacterium]|nr:NERD domain-containing protein [Deltaproteobacteria bacterium]